VDILPQIAQRTQRNTASCIISQRKTGWDSCGYCGYCGYWSFGFCGSSASSARSAGDTWVSFVQYRLSTLACYSPADYADYAEGMQQAALFRRERQLVVSVSWGIFVN
jgi:hypothetical protein